MVLGIFLVLLRHINIRKRKQMYNSNSQILKEILKSTLFFLCLNGMKKLKYLSYEQKTSTQNEKNKNTIKMFVLCLKFK